MAVPVRVTIFDSMDFPPYQYKEYPKYLYQQKEDKLLTMVVNAPTEQKSAGPEWHETPDAARKAVAAKLAPASAATPSSNKVKV